MSFKKRAALVLYLVLSGDPFGDKGIEATKEMVKKEVRKTFTAWRLCMAKETTHQGCLSLQGLEAGFSSRRVREERGRIDTIKIIHLEGGG